MSTTDFDINKLVREHIKNVKPYSSARDEFSGEASVYLDANENGLGSPLIKWYNRYPDPYQKKIKDSLSKIKAVPAEQIFIGNGSDECIDLLYRCFCEPGRDNVIICPPTYGMYEVSAAINNVKLRRADLFPDYQLN
ncbi:MAG TPA: aminotransferase class I/II-fold pyridoxal phosphate-dependent enzyme, partial [Chitinophagaceae bacterium]|nr:aminotransferase class I/II-fold pyridoxal phosphate-dependent enzyme [Chitinophagaceae bacterium]